MKKLEELKESIEFEELNEMLRDCIGYDGYFNDLDYWENDQEFFDCMYNDKMELVRALSYGNYNYMDAYVKINAYGNIESCSDFEYQKNVEDQKEEIVEHYLELYADDNVYPSNSLKEKLYNYYEESEEESEGE